MTNSRFAVIRGQLFGSWLVVNLTDECVVSDCPTRDLADHICYRLNDLSRPVIRHYWPERIRKRLREVPPAG